jgi:hypothetical protein
MKQFLFIVTLLEALTFFLAASLHSGIEVLSMREPRIIPAMIVEGLCGIFLFISACTIIGRSRSGWAITLAAHIFSIAGVLLGIGALAMGRGPTTELNYYYHRTILAVLIIMVIILFNSAGKSALRPDVRIEAP